MNIKVNISRVYNIDEFAISLRQIEKIQSSFSNDKSPIGVLRWEGVSNGRYERYHPVTDATGNTIGYMVGGIQEVGYTYCGIYSDKAQRFFISHVPFSMVWGAGAGEKKSYISTVDKVGNFWLFKKGIKFRRTNSFGFPMDWVGSEHIYRFINDGKSLLCVTGLGFCIINVFQPSLTVSTFFGNQHTHMVTAAELSQNENILAITMCEWSYTDPVKGKEIYRNSLRLFDIRNGNKIGEIDLGIEDSASRSKIDFSDCGSYVSLSINEQQFFFQFNTFNSN